MSTIRDYYQLTKPGIVYGNVITTIAAFLFAIRWRIESLHTLSLFAATVIGISLVIAGSCVFNNYLDRNIDRRMARTQKRPLITGAISGRAALIYGTILGILGFVLLILFVNVLTAAIALVGVIFYVILYGLAKRGSRWGAVVGSISGAVPIVVGYTAVVNQLDLTALMLFLVLVFWQMPHFYAIAIYRFDEYKAANIPTLPAQKGIPASKVHILLYLIAYLVAAIVLGIVAPMTPVYFAIVLVFGVRWLWQAIQGFKIKSSDDAAWARRVFLSSLVVLLTFSAAITVDPFIAFLIR